MGQKRRRIALSCVDCRRRKVKCDRNYPQCIRCQKGGYGDKCVYVRHTGTDRQDSIVTPDDEGDRRSGSEASWADDAEQYESTARSNEVRAQQLSGSTSMAASRSARPLERVNREINTTQERKLAHLHLKLMELETMVYAAGGKPTNTDWHFGVSNPLADKDNNPNYYADKYTLADHEKVLLKGKSFKTQYYGPSNNFAILLQFEDLSKFIREILLAIPSLTNQKIAMSKLREKEKGAARAHYDTSLENLISMVPERSFADRLVSQYLDTIETTYRIIHVPTFLKDYEAFWTTPREARPDFLIQLLVIMAMMYCIVPGGEEGYVGRSSARREKASHWVNLCNYWLESQSQKHVSLVNYQLHIQLWYAKWLNCMKAKRFWTDSGVLVRRFMAAGLHREPSLLCGKINTFDCEMRRRLWHTVLELDLQATVDRGITPTLGPMDWDTEPPRNIDDESFDMDSDVLPDAKPRGTFTRTSYLAWASESLSTRIELLYKINSIRNTLDHDTINTYDDKLRIWIDDIPLDKWADAVLNPPISTTTSPNTHYLPTPSSLPSPPPPTPHPLVAITLSQAVTREYLTILHQPFATDPTFKSRHFHSRVARRYACIFTIFLYNPQLSRNGALSSTAATQAMDTRFHLSDSQRRFFATFREDYLRAALSLAHDFALSAASDSNPFMIRVQDDARVIHLIEAAVNMLGDLVLIQGQGFHCYWIASSALSYVHSKQSPEVPRKTFVHAAADRVVVMHMKVIEGQLQRAKDMMVPTEEGVVLPPIRSASPATLAMAEQAAAEEATEDITTVEGARRLQRKRPAGHMDPPIGTGTGTTSINPYFTAGMADMSGGMMGFEQGPTPGIRSGDPLQDMMFELENMDWNMLMNTDPTEFMSGTWHLPS